MSPNQRIPETPNGKVWFDGSHWVATINDWWYAVGRTEADAIRKATKLYEDEMERMKKAA